jgi:hypothetical protein
MAVFVSPRVKTELDDIWLPITTESVSIDIASRVYEHRGRVFKEIVRGLADEAGRP